MNESIEIPLGKRTKKYRFFEILPGMMSYLMLFLLVFLSWWNPIIAGIYLLVIIFTIIVKAIRLGIYTVRGYRLLEKAQKIDWRSRLNDLSNPAMSLTKWQGNKSNVFHKKRHICALEDILKEPGEYPKPDDLYHIIIVAAYSSFCI